MECNKKYGLARCVLSTSEARRRSVTGYRGGFECSKDLFCSPRVTSRFQNRDGGMRLAVPWEASLSGGKKKTQGREPEAQR